MKVEKFMIFSKKSVFGWFLLLIFGCGWLASCSHRQPLPNHSFTDEVRLKTTPVKNQGSSDLCWIYAMLATIESERLSMGDSVNLSPIFLARRFMEAETDSLFRLKNDGEAFSHRGMATTALHLLHRYGAQPFDFYHGYQNADFKVLEKKIKSLISKGLKKNISSEEFRRQLGDLLDKTLGFVPRFVHMLGAEYTSQEFGHSVCLEGDYEAFTSFTHRPFGERMALEVPDNRFGDAFLNIPLDSLMQKIDHSLMQGHPVCWEGDISESGYSFSEGLAVLEPTPDGQKVSENQRQREFERGKTTDDHCMALVGIAHDEQGNRFYIAKNSLGTDNPYGGFMYLSEDYIRLKTLCIVVPKAVDSDFSM